MSFAVRVALTCGDSTQFQSWEPLHFSMLEKHLAAGVSCLSCRYMCWEFYQSVRRSVGHHTITESACNHGTTVNQKHVDRPHTGKQNSPNQLRRRSGLLSVDPGRNPRILQCWASADLEIILLAMGYCGIAVPLPTPCIRLHSHSNYRPLVTTAYWSYLLWTLPSPVSLWK